MKRLFCITIGVIALVFAGVITVHAQAAPIDLGLSTIPLNPEPLQQVTITAQSYSTDLSQADLVWTYNNQTIASSIGETQITVTAPASGGTGIITLTASGAGFTATTTSLILRPGSVDLLWEGADSYTPPFYKGRALPSTGGMIRVTAIPSINAPRDMSYDWTQNDSALPSVSGYNKTSIEFQNNDLIPTETIAVTDSSGNYSGNNSVDITPGSPSIIGYLNTNGFIDYANGSADSLNTSGTGAIVHFEPYFFSVPNSIEKDLAVTYTDNSGNTLPPGDAKNEIPISEPSDGGEAQFNVAISTLVYSLQNLSKAFAINFN